jgi:dihydrolipoamide dehydrogenase
MGDIRCRPIAPIGAGGYSFLPPQRDGSEMIQDASGHFHRDFSRFAQCLLNRDPTEHHARHTVAPEFLPVPLVFIWFARLLLVVAAQLVDEVASLLLEIGDSLIELALGLIGLALGLLLLVTAEIADGLLQIALALGELAGKFVLLLFHGVLHIRFGRTLLPGRVPQGLCGANNKENAIRVPYVKRDTTPGCRPGIVTQSLPNAPNTASSRIRAPFRPIMDNERDRFRRTIQRGTAGHTDPEGRSQFMADVQEFDLVILGAGTGGYYAAFRAKQLGLNVAVVEKDKVGGVCLHRGCVPTKAFLKSAHFFEDVKHAKDMGIEFSGDATLNFDTVVKRSLSIVSKQHNGLQYLFEKKNKVPVFKGNGVIKSRNEVEVTLNDSGDKVTLKCQKLIINTGSRPRPIRGIEFDGKTVFNSDHSVVREDVPRSLIVRGLGATGVEWGQIYHSAGSQVTFVGNVVPQEDDDVQREMTKQFKRQGITVIEGARPNAENFEISDKGVKMTVKDKKGKEHVVEAEALFVATGREPNVENIGLETIGVELNEKGFVRVDNLMRTNVEGVYAIGDVNGEQMLAHTAGHHGIVAAEHAAGKNPFPINHLHIPSFTYTTPEIGSVGMTEKQAKDAGYNVKIGRFPLSPNAKAVIEGKTEGFTKIITDADTDDVLGIHMVGVAATERIAEGGLGMTLNVSGTEMALTVHPHPTVSEVMGQAAMDIFGEAIDI